ncbi:MAG: ribosomal protein L7/L12 [Tidjanibacter sp.]|nr:ribosomal protein L7/L12 [Tidjanibacter sp.]
MKYDVFISYSRKDTPIADQICAAFDRAGISYFIDRQGIGGGFEFPVVLAEAILESQVILFLASVNSYESKFTNAELTFAFNEKPKNSILPYIIDGSTMPPALRFVFASINWRTIENQPIEPVLVNDILGLLGKPKTEVRSNPAQPQYQPQAQPQPQPQSQPQAQPSNVGASLSGDSFDVVLVDAGVAKLGCVKCVKELTGWGLAESKSAVDNIPTVVFKGVSHAEAESAVRELDNCGATAEIRPSAAASAPKSAPQPKAAPQPAVSAQPKPAAQPVAPKPAAKTYKVGDYYDKDGKRGVVFEVTADGLHGKIVSLDQVKLPWAVDKNFGSLFNKQNPNKIRLGFGGQQDGQDHTRRIQQIENWREKYPAFAWCVQMGRSWYLPALNEVRLIYQNADTVNRTLGQKGATLFRDGYWSASEVLGTDDVWFVMGTAKSLVGYLYKSFSANVRAVARF